MGQKSQNEKIKDTERERDQAIENWENLLKEM